MERLTFRFIFFVGWVEGSVLLPETQQYPFCIITLLGRLRFLSLLIIFCRDVPLGRLYFTRPTIWMALQ